jgi:hypothetical protein
VASSEPQRLFLDTRELRDRTRLRLTASLPALVGGLWLVWTTGSWLLRAFALAGVTFATIWLVIARRTAIQLSNAPDHYLDIGAEALQVCAGAERRTLAWTDIEAVEIDEDRLVVSLRLSGGGRLVIEPQYGELDLPELAERLERSRARAMTRVGAGETSGMRSRQS